MRPSVSGIVRHALLYSTLLAFLAGCATSSAFVDLDPAHYESSHRTRLVLVKHPTLSYSWSVQGDYGSTAVEIRRDRIRDWGVTHQKAQERELDLLEPYLARFPDLSSVTREIYFNTLAEASTGAGFLELEPYGGTVPVNGFEEIEEPLEGTLPFTIPSEDAGTAPQWYLVLEVARIGLVKVGNQALGSNLQSILTGLVIEALTKKEWYAVFSGQLVIADAGSSAVLWKRPVSGGRWVGGGSRSDRGGGQRRVSEGLG